MAAKLTRLTHKVVIQLLLVAESCTICSSCSGLICLACPAPLSEYCADFVDLVALLIPFSNSAVNS